MVCALFSHCRATHIAEERQDRNEKRRRVDEHRQQDMAKAAKEGSMTMNGTEYVQVPTVASAVPSRVHPSLPSRPGFEVVPKAQSAQSGQPPAGTSTGCQEASVVLTSSVRSQK